MNHVSGGFKVSDEIPTARYKEFEIRPTPYQLLEPKEWTIEILIMKHTGDSVAMRDFSTSNSFPTEEEAIQQCFEFGKKIIDGEVAGCSVLDL